MAAKRGSRRGDEGVVFFFCFFFFCFFLPFFIYFVPPHSDE